MTSPTKEELRNRIANLEAEASRRAANEKKLRKANRALRDELGQYGPDDTADRRVDLAQVQVETVNRQLQRAWGELAEYKEHPLTDTGIEREADESVGDWNKRIAKNNVQLRAENKALRARVGELEVELEKARAG